uniref:Uncharacterized protein n=1 Tax=viral metagenome TaxID=1070528 RepID=A0A6C0F2R9_9ZZZZ
MKYLIVKGACGFGDRLQTLKMCVKFALEKGLQIYVDWADPIWSHNGETFYTYFDLVNIKKLNSIDDIPEDATVHPPYWKGDLKKQILPYMYNNKEINLGYLNSNTSFDADVIVFSSVGLRWIYNDSAFFANVFRVIDSRIISKVRQRQMVYNLKDKLGVHLRGTDRASRIDKSKRMDGVNIRLITMGLLNGLKCVALSDDPEYIAIWKSRYRNYPVLTEAGNLGGNEGVHNKSKDSLSVLKDTLNVDLLVDFFTLASCKGILSTSKDSRFAQEAMRFNKFTDRILSRT